MKFLLRQSLKVPLLLNGLLKQHKRGGIGYLIYHSVAGQLGLELNLPLPLFRRQLQFLARSRQVISYEEALQRLQTGQVPETGNLVLTFDDGYENFYTQVFPLLRDLALPAMLFVNTGFVETGIPYPILSRGGHEVRPVTWDMLGQMAESGLVTVGAHTHTHPDLTQISEAQLIEELAKPLELFQKRLGLHTPHFAYPKALWNLQVERWVAQYYRSAVISEAKKAVSNNFNPYRIPRIPIRQSDGWWFFQAKMGGWLEGEEALYEKLRHLLVWKQIAVSKDYSKGQL